MGTIGGNVLVDTRCNYYDQTYFWRQAVGFCMKKDGDICLVAPGSAKCLAIASSDTAPVLVSLGAEAILVGRQGERRVKLEDLYRDDGIEYSAKAKDEVLKGLFIPRKVWRGAMFISNCAAAAPSTFRSWAWPRQWISTNAANAVMPASC